MLRHLQKVDNTQEAGASRQFGRDVRHGDPPDRGHFNESFAQSVTPADLDVRPPPYPHAAGDFSAHDWRAKSLRERHQYPQPLLRTSPSIDAAARDVILI